MDTSDQKIETWAIVEVFGHTKLAGFLRSVPLGSAVMLRIEVPEVTYNERTGWGESATTVERTIPAFTKFYSPSAIFSITPTTEETARAAMKSWHVEPVSNLDIKALPAPEAYRSPMDSYAGSADDDGWDENDDEGLEPNEVPVSTNPFEPEF